MKKKIALTMGGTLFMAGITYFVLRLTTKNFGRENQEVSTTDYESLDEQDVAYG